MKNKILVCYNDPVSLYDNYLGKELSSNEEFTDLSEKGFSQQIDFIKNKLEKNFSEVYTLGFNRDILSIINSIKNINPDVIVNFVESIDGDAEYESHVTGLYELLGIRYTGNYGFCLANCLSKTRTKQILSSHKISTPKFLTLAVNEKLEESKLNMSFPLIVKLAREDASIGISELSVVKDSAELKRQINFLRKNYKQSVIIEEYIEGREINVSILGDKVLPLSEIRFDGLPENYPKIITYEAKWSPNSIYYKNTVPKCPADVSDKLRIKIEQIAYEAFNALGCRDYARVDIRLSNKNVPYVIEVNPNPDISVDSGFVRSASYAGLNYSDLLKTLVEFALNRKAYDTTFAVEG